jgi:exonuclease V gamma subunit
MTLAAPRTLHQQIADARAQQLKARADRTRSANADTIAAAKLADREVDVLLDRLSAALRTRR